jgi:Ser/Thr protein kinase RdoA (MazF antagonist)
MFPALDRGALAAFVERRLGVVAREVEMDIRPLQGGLESPAVARVGTRFVDEGGKPRSFSFVVKSLEGGPAREAEIYERLVSQVALEFSPGLWGIDRLDGDRCLLFLEPVRPARRWPWRETETAARLLERLARFHSEAETLLARGPLPFLSWDYERDLADSARRTLASLEEMPRGGDFAALRRSLPALRRTASVLPQIRRRLLAYPPLGRTVIHGDVHPGNAMVRIREARERPVLLDWGRARIGSPLEDVSSWLQSLGYWEPQARRRHDTLLAGYLKARGLAPALDRGLRDAYWIAAASNALAGALSYHLWQASGATEGSRERAAALHAAGDCLRVIRRADTYWRQVERRRPPRPREPAPPPPG